MPVRCINHLREEVVVNSCFEMSNAVEKGYSLLFFDENNVELDFHDAWYSLGGHHKTDPIFDGGSDCTWWYDSEGHPLHQVTFVNDDGTAKYK